MLTKFALKGIYIVSQNKEDTTDISVESHMLVLTVKSTALLNVTLANGVNYSDVSEEYTASILISKLKWSRQSALL
jgi:hypothetical protein